MSNDKQQATFYPQQDPNVSVSIGSIGGTPYPAQQIPYPTQPGVYGLYADPNGGSHQFIKLAEASIMQDGPKTNVAYILLIFFGLLGVHRFYIGSIGLGIAYIFTLGFFGVGPFVDIFILQSSINKANARREAMGRSW
jgi:hypothetical protein